MKKLGLLVLLLSSGLFGQAQIPPVVFRIPSAQLNGLVPASVAAGDAIEVIVQTSNPAAAAVRITLTYLDAAGKPVTLVSERPIFIGVTGKGFDIHSFTVPSSQVPVISVRQTELTVATDQTYTGF